MQCSVNNRVPRATEIHSFLIRAQTIRFFIMFTIFKCWKIQIAAFFFSKYCFYNKHINLPTKTFILINLIKKIEVKNLQISWIEFKMFLTPAMDLSCLNLAVKNGHPLKNKVFYSRHGYTGFYAFLPALPKMLYM